MNNCQHIKIDVLKNVWFQIHECVSIVVSLIEVLDSSMSCVEFKIKLMGLSHVTFFFDSSRMAGM